MGFDNLELKSKKSSHHQMLFTMFAENYAR